MRAGRACYTDLGRSRAYPSWAWPRQVIDVVGWPEEAWSVPDSWGEGADREGDVWEERDKRKERKKEKEKKERKRGSSGLKIRIYTLCGF